MFVYDFACLWHESHESEGELAGAGFAEVGFTDFIHWESGRKVYDLVV